MRALATNVLGVVLFIGLLPPAASAQGLPAAEASGENLLPNPSFEETTAVIEAEQRCAPT